MKKNVLLLVIASSLFLSCSSDKNEDEMENSANAIVGTWDATALQVDDSASDEAVFGSQILQRLTDDNCVIITLQFNQDLTAVATNSTNYIEINATATGFDVPCPTQSDTESSTYVYESGVVSILDADGQTINVDVSIDGDTMTVDASDLDLDGSNFSGDGELIFTKR